MNLSARDAIAKNGFDVVSANFQWRNIAKNIPLAWAQKGSCDDPNVSTAN
jgi:hypothetical protein